MSAARIFLCCLIIPLSVCAADPPDGSSSPSGPGDVLRPKRSGDASVYLGFDLGLNFAHYMGDHVYLFTNPFDSRYAFHSRFKDGDGLGFMIQGVIDVPVSEKVGIVGKLGYISRVDVFSTTFDYPLAYIDPVTGWPGTATLKGDMDLSVTFFNLDLLLRYQLAPQSWYLLGGLSISQLLGNSADFSQRILAPDNVYYTNPLELPIREVNMSDLEISGYEKTRAALKIGVGTWVKLSDAVFLTPELCVDYPFTTFAKYEGEPLAFVPDTDIRFLTISLTAGLRFGL